MEEEEKELGESKTMSNRQKFEHQFSKIQENFRDLEVAVGFDRIKAINQDRRNTFPQKMKVNSKISSLIIELSGLKSMLQKM